MKASARTFIKSRVDKTSHYFSEGMQAFNAGKTINDCPYNGFTDVGRKALLNWLAGFNHRKTEEKGIKRDASGRGVFRD